MLRIAVFVLAMAGSGTARAAEPAPVGAEGAVASTQAGPPPTAADAGQWLYVQKGCLGCHGASGRGGVGPTLAHTALSLDDLVHQLRQPRGIMPPFPPDVVSDDEARLIHGYLTSLATPPPRARTQQAPHGVLDPSTCAPCHEKLEPTIVRQFQGSAMGKPGVQNPRVGLNLVLTCANCHGQDHDVITASMGRVPETTCAGCHPQIYQEAVLDPGHSYGPGPGDLGINWERNIGVPNYAQMPRKVMEMGCDTCHAQAGATDAKYWSDEQHKYVDTSSLPYRNGCIACHTRHSFDPAEARKPEACHTCHMGPDHPNYEAYESSKHGSIYGARGAGWDFKVPLAEATYDAPTCAYCHMLYVDDDGTRHTSHDMTKKIVWGMGVQAASGSLDDLTLLPENQGKRTEMVKVCTTCHSEDKAREYLESADAHKLAGDALVIEARGILKGLYDDGLLQPGHAVRAAGLLPGPQFSAIELPGAVAQHWPAGLYFNVSDVEREYFDLFFFSNLRSYKGAFHMSPDYGWWYGYADALGHLARLRDEAQRLRDARTVQRRTDFMLLTGPLMVLAVIGALWLLTRWRERRARRASP